MTETQKNIWSTIKSISEGNKHIYDAIRIAREIRCELQARGMDNGSKLLQEGSQNDVLC